MIDAKTIKVTILKKMVQKCMKELLKEIQSNSIKEKPKKPRKPKKKESKKKLTDKVPKPKKEKKPPAPLPIEENLSESAQKRRYEANMKVLARNS